MFPFQMNKQILQSVKTLHTTFFPALWFSSHSHSGENFPKSSSLVESSVRYHLPINFVYASILSGSSAQIMFKFTQF